ncbi:uncharacterized protein CDAR_60811 [Caerostris darwini]|uniref:Uncharacterized protein n=1 Tax=Caerostris darwini TaxID=1538125 RepID=A0AAV4VJ45_9ARAC|nr:uncharacterized protein CDAR_60811 [Caerostris darwini]
MMANIYNINKLLYFTIQVEHFSKRYPTVQCFNCNHFHHSRENYRRQTKCLKCGKDHLTAICHIKEKLANPKSINCSIHGFIASWKRYKCKAFTKVDLKKGQAIPQYRTRLQLQQNQKFMKSNASNTQLFKTAQTPPFTEVPYFSDLFYTLQLLKELQCIINAFTKLTEDVKYTELHHVQNPQDKFGILMMALSAKDSS